MSATAVVTMIVILGFVWGGAVLLAVTAVRKERAKSAASGPDPDATAERRGGGPAGAARGPGAA